MYSVLFGARSDRKIVQLIPFVAYPGKSDIVSFSMVAKVLYDRKKLITFTARYARVAPRLNIKVRAKADLVVLFSRAASSEIVSGAINMNAEQVWLRHDDILFFLLPLALAIIAFSFEINLIDASVK